MYTNRWPMIVTAAMLAVALNGCSSRPSAGCVELEAASKQLAANLQMYETTWDQIINKRDIDQINEAHFDKGITLVTSPANVVGIEAFRAYYNNYLTGFTEVRFTIIDAFGQGDKIVKHWNFKGRHTGEFFGIPATGREVDIDGVTLVLMKEGRIAQEQDFLDNLEFMQQLGLIPREQS